MVCVRPADHCSLFPTLHCRHRHNHLPHHIISCLCFIQGPAEASGAPQGGIQELPSSTSLLPGAAAVAISKALETTDGRARLLLQGKTSDSSACSTMFDESIARGTLKDSGTLKGVCTPFYTVVCSADSVTHSLSSCPFMFTHRARHWIALHALPCPMRA